MLYHAEAKSFRQSESGQVIEIEDRTYYKKPDKKAIRRWRARDK
jgi:uncharacterized protein YecE (DUF72 family)